MGRDTPEHLSDLKKLPCGNWRYVIAMPHEHELAKIPEITLALLAKYPLLTYNFTFSGTTVATRAFQRSGVSAYNVAFESDDAAILLQYAQLGLGVALFDDAACANYSGDLMIRDVGHLFEPSQFQILLRSDAVIRSYIYDFIERLNGNLTRETVDKLLYAPAMVDFSI